eukprot:5249148-Alexandrium_andersonii.AAC.1
MQGEECSGLFGLVVQIEFVLLAHLVSERHPSPKSLNEHPRTPMHVRQRGIVHETDLGNRNG